MKHIVITFAALLLTLGMQAQDLKEKDVPSVVKEAFHHDYPTATASEWEKEGDNYEVEFKNSGTEMSAEYSADGKIISSETEISPSQLPEAARNYIAEHFPGQKISEACKITAADGTVTYEAEVQKSDYLFDANGIFLSKETEDDHDD